MAGAAIVALAVVPRGWAESPKAGHPDGTVPSDSVIEIRLPAGTVLPDAPGSYSTE